MTKLLDAILESEMNGEISSEVSEKMLKVLNESAIMEAGLDADAIKKSMKEIKKVEKDLKAINIKDKNAGLKLSKVILTIIQLYGAVSFVTQVADSFTGAYTGRTKITLGRLLNIACSYMLAYTNGIAVSALTSAQAKQLANKVDSIISKETDEDNKKKLQDAKEKLEEASRVIDENLAASKLVKNKQLNESTILDLYEAVYEKEMNGEITEEERDMLIEKLDEKFM